MKSDTERRGRRLKAILGEDISKVPDDRVARIPDAAKVDDPVRAILTHPDGSVEELRMSRRGREGKSTTTGTRPVA